MHLRLRTHPTSAGRNFVFAAYHSSYRRTGTGSRPVRAMRTPSSPSLHTPKSAPNTNHATGTRTDPSIAHNTVARVRQWWYLGNVTHRASGAVRSSSTTGNVRSPYSHQEGHRVRSYLFPFLFCLLLPRCVRTAAASVSLSASTGGSRATGPCSRATATLAAARSPLRCYARQSRSVVW